MSACVWEVRDRRAGKNLATGTRMNECQRRACAFQAAEKGSAQ